MAIIIKLSYHNNPILFALDLNTFWNICHFVFKPFKIILILSVILKKSVVYYWAHFPHQYTKQIQNSTGLNDKFDFNVIGCTFCV